MLDLKKPFMLGDWRVEPDRLCIECGGEERHLEPKAMGMLVYLAQHAGETVSRETLGREVWAGTFGSDEAISRVVSLLRSQLGDNSRKPRYIETIPKLGYRLAIHPQPARRRRRIAPKFSQRAVGLVAVLLVISLSLTGYLLLRPEPPATEVEKVYTIAVLPFRDISSEEADRFLSVGLTDELISHLNQSPQLRIVARNSLEDRQEAGVRIDYFIEGSIAVIADRLRVHVEIIDGEERVIVWSDNYETSRTNYVAVQREMSSLINEALSRELDIDAALPRPAALNLDAYTAYLNGIFMSKLRGEEPLRASIEAFSSALAMEPGFENARVALARAQALLPFYSMEEQTSAFAEATRLLNALEQRPHAEAASIRGFIAYRQWRWQEAEAYFLDSLELDPNHANTHVWYSQFLAVVGRLEESLQHARMAYELDSVSAVVNDRLATAHLWNDQDDEAERLFSAGANLGFNSLQNPSYLVLLLRRQDYDALRLGLRALHPRSDLGALPDNLEYLYVPEARPQLVAMLDTLITQQQLSPRLEFGVWIILQQWDRALATIAKYRENEKKYLDFEFLFAQESESLRNDPLFEEITATIGMQGYWQQAVGQPDFRQNPAMGLNSSE